MANNPGNANASKEPVEPGGVGELCVRSPLVMNGYWKQPEQTAEARRNGWLHTDDMARRDSHGYYYLVDHSLKSDSSMKTMLRPSRGALF